MQNSERESALECLAAIAYGPNQPLKVEQILVFPPKAGEVRVKILHTTVCHTDLYTLSGSDPEAKFPCILGHEASGIVESIGEGVTSVNVGDYVVPLYIPQCYECKFCRHPKTNLCSKIRTTQGRGVMPDGSSRFMTPKGEIIYHFMGTSTFSEYTVLPEISIAKVEKGMNLEHAALLGCGLSTGYGAAVNIADVQAGDTVAIFGLGTVGLSVAMGCKSRGASRIIGVDVCEDRLQSSKEFGITDTVNTTSMPEGVSIEDELIKMTDGGLDHTFECVGKVAVMRSALQAAHRGWGQCVIIGVAEAEQEISTRPFNFITGRVLKGCAFGGWKSRDSIPKLLELCHSGKLDAEKLITHRKKNIRSLPDAKELLASGETLRCLVDYQASN